MANGVRTLQQMAGRRPLAADNGSAQALSMMRTTLGRDRSVTVGLEGEFSEDEMRRPTPNTQYPWGLQKPYGL